MSGVRLAARSVLAPLIIPYVASAGGGNVRVYYVTLDPGQDPTALSAVTANVTQDPVLSPDRSLVAWLQTGALRTINVDGTNEQVILTGGGYLSLQWKPDGTKLIFESRAAGDEHKIFTCNPDGSSKTQIYADPSSRKVFYPKFNYDGTKIAFLVVLSSTSWGLWTANADGSGATQIDTIPTQFEFARAYAWANTQNKIAFSNWTGGSLFTINADGTGKTTIASVTNYIVLSRCWSTDDTYVYYRATDGSSDLRKAEADGGGTSLVYAAFANSFPQLHSGRIYEYGSIHGGLVSVLENGTDFRVENNVNSELEAL